MGGSNLVYLFVAYLIIWIGLFGYTFFVAQQVSDLRAQVEALRRRSRSQESPEPPAR